jgi:hypothetical protein
VVLDQQHRHAALVARIEDEARHVFLLLLVHAGHRLVQDQEARLGDQRAGQFDPLLQPDRDVSTGSSRTPCSCMNSIVSSTSRRCEISSGWPSHQYSAA